MATSISTDVVLAPLTGRSRTVQEWLTTFHLAVVALDPFTREGAWILPVATRVLTHFSQADVRVALLLPATPAESRMFLGPWVNSLLTFADPDRSAIEGFGFDRLPVFAHVAMDGTLEGSAVGWQPPEWQAVADNLARVTGWTTTVVDREGDPAPF
ncbi:MAG TPA: hypothetical protein VMZ22_05920 [Acidimicrobiales bacterium]|nr:hypothetical protein [Acidimicrobiales bacterium]